MNERQRSKNVGIISLGEILMQTCGATQQVGGMNTFKIEEKLNQIREEPLEGELFKPIFCTEDDD